mmetsp:Transcript_28765/g.91660  ORF Transcript_28765/g.91660 Transcript_28765/m.91660 type:complete len:466 (-) Transcript_28765:78-1475(-)
MLGGQGQSRGHGPGGRRDESAVLPEFTTLNKDGKPVWEPGLPAEVTSRRIHKPVKKDVPEEVPVSCDLRSTLKLPPGARADWLDKALRAIPQGRAKVQDVFNVVTHPKFVAGVPDRVGRKMLQRVAESLDAFSDKQRTTLVAKCKLAELFQASALGAEGEEDDEVDEEPLDVAAAPVALEERLPREARGRSRSRSRRRRSRSAEGRPRRSRSPRRFVELRGTGGQGPAVPEEQPRQLATGTGPAVDGTREDALQASGGAQRELTPQEQATLERSFMERQRQQEEERRKLEVTRKAFEEREKQRKAKLGSAFLVGGEEEEDEATRTSAASGPLLVRKGQADRSRVEELPYAEAPPAQSERYRPVASGAGQDLRFVEAMGGDRVLAEAHAILLNAAGSGRLGAPAPPRSPSRGRRKRSRSWSRGPNVRSSGSYRSPTPDGRARGQARAARKAKMIASLMGISAAGRR